MPRFGVKRFSSERTRPMSRPARTTLASRFHAATIGIKPRSSYEHMSGSSKPRRRVTPPTEDAVLTQQAGMACSTVTDALSGPYRAIKHPVQSSVPTPHQSLLRLCQPLPEVHHQTLFGPTFGLNRHSLAEFHHSIARQMVEVRRIRRYPIEHRIKSVPDTLPAKWTSHHRSATAQEER
jgi:hypothetical protein